MGLLFLLLLIGASAQSLRSAEGAPVVRADISFVQTTLSAPASYIATVSSQSPPTYTDSFLNTFRAQDRFVYPSFPDLFSAMNDFSMPDGSRSAQASTFSPRPMNSIPSPSISSPRAPSPMPSSGCSPCSSASRPASAPPTYSSSSSSSSSSYITSLSNSNNYNTKYPLPTSYDLLSSYLPNSPTSKTSNSNSNSQSSSRPFSTTNIGAARVSAYYSSISSGTSQISSLLAQPPRLSQPQQQSQQQQQQQQQARPGYGSSNNNNNNNNGGSSSVMLDAYTKPFRGDYDYDPDPLTPFSAANLRPRPSRPTSTVSSTVSSTASSASSSSSASSASSADQAAVMVFEGPVAIRVPSGNMLQLVPLPSGQNANAILFPSEVPANEQATTIVYAQDALGIQQQQQQQQQPLRQFPLPPLPASSSFPPVTAPAATITTTTTTTTTTTAHKPASNPPLHTGQQSFVSPLSGPTPKQQSQFQPTPKQLQQLQPTFQQQLAMKGSQLYMPTPIPITKSSSSLSSSLGKVNGNRGKTKVAEPTRAPQLILVPSSPRFVSQAQDLRLASALRPASAPLLASNSYGQTVLVRPPCSTFNDCELCVADPCEWNLENLRCMNSNECQPPNATYCVFWPRDCPGSTIKFRDVP